MKIKIVALLEFDRIDIFSSLFKKLSTYHDLTLASTQYTPKDIFLEKKILLKKQNISVISFNKYFNISFFQKYTSKLNKRTSLFLLLKEKILYFNYLYTYLKAYKYLKKNNIEVLLIRSDNYHTNEIGFIKAAYDLKIKIIIPSSIMMEPNLSLSYPRSHYQLSNENTIYEKLSFKKYLHKSYGIQIYKNFFNKQAYILNFLSNNNLLSKSPWIFGGSDMTDILCVSNQFHKDISIKYGVEKSKIKIIGDINYDNLYPTSQEKNTHYLKKNISNKIIILALPQLFEHHYLNKEDSKKEIDFLVSKVSSIQDTTLYLSLHPIMDKLTYKYLEEQYNCKIIEDSLNTFLPIADLFVCPPSNTVIWSALCGINTVVFDFYNWNYSSMKVLKSYTFVNDKKKLQKEILYLLDNKIDFTNAHKLLSKDIVFNGKVLETYLNLIDNLAIDKTANSTLLLTLKISILSFWVKYIDNKKLKKLKKINSLIEKYNEFYISPYSPITEDLKDTLNKSDKFKGFIDSNIKKKNIFHVNDIENNNSLVIIYSPNHADVIYKSLKTKFVSVIFD